MMTQKLLLFGAGGAGKKFMETFHDNVVCLADNDPDKQGKTLAGKEIIAPSQIQNQEFDAIVIASEFENEIRQQLVELGYGPQIATIKRRFVSLARDDVEELVFTHGGNTNEPVLQTMHLNLTSACNIHCRTCRPEHNKYKATYLDRETIENIVHDVFDKITHLRLDSSGELTLSPHLEYVLEEATKRNISIFISTNGTKIDEKLADLIVRSSVEYMQVSLDSPDEATNEWIRKGAKHKDILRGVDLLVKAKKKYNKHYPEIHFHGAILQQNVHQLKDMVQLAKDKEIDGVTFAYGFIHSYMNLEWSVFFDRELCNEKVAEANALARELGLFFGAPTRFLLDSDKKPKEKYCQYLFNWTYVDPSGKIFPCCTGAGEYVVGDATTEKLSDIWMNDRYQKLRETYNTDSPEWDKCSRCYMLTGWDADDYRVHFDPNHWREVKARLGMALPENLICRSG